MKDKMIAYNHRDASAKVPMKRNFLFFLMKEHKKFGGLLFTVSQ